MKKLASLMVIGALVFGTAMPVIASGKADFNCSFVSQIPTIECEALVALYNSTNGPGWTDNTNWLVTTTPADWYGVTVETGHVTGLYFAQFTGNGFTGNNLSGPIPPEIGNLASLKEVYFQSNRLSGTIPPSLQNLQYLGNLFLQDNLLSGPIPPELGQLWRLFQINLGGNQLTGTIPSSFQNYVNLTALVLSDNQLTGQIPVFLGTFYQRLYSLNLSGNQLSGSIPVELGDLVNLGFLDLSNNNLTGFIPSELGNLIKLQMLRLQGNQLVGDIPSTFTNLTSLAIPGGFYDGGDGLDLDYNYLTVPTDYPNASNPLHVLLSSKDLDWHLRQALEGTIGPGGGSLTSLDDRVEIIVPPGTLPGETIFTFVPQPIPGHQTDRFTFAGTSFLLLAEDNLGNPIEAFTPPLTINLNYFDEDLNGATERMLGLYYWDNSIPGWVDAVTTCSGGFYTRDMENNTLSLPVCHLTEFAGMVPWSQVYLPILIR